MFEKLAQFRPFGPRLACAAAAIWSHQTPASNDNQPGFRHPAGRRRIPKPALVCHWILIDGERLVCRWEAEHTGTPHDGRSTAATPPAPHHPPRRAAV
ncbi:hypothetical protein [Bradyrhizobium sp. 2TAF24]|uniref:hypothetical protein n=1 Tax=Bradyrhizobium sp. 2TAF24 TaxID=3233011 RepID=UPI003F903498